ncbi:Ima1 N-terminal domain-containing protein [Tricladium varicosporioides]|nr:Ima1 N-terminal domain-containing protein [Hymenoscyphus varicosporioides]
MFLLGGRIMSRSASPSGEPGNISFVVSPNHGPMAFLKRQKNLLVCFYCNKKSGIQYDGFITQWECANCGAENYLDQNGEITDPPVATEYTEVEKIERPYVYDRSNVKNHLEQAKGKEKFCSGCARNHHLLVRALAEFDVIIDQMDPRYRQNEKEFRKYRNSMEERYPQVCEDCLPGVNKEMNLSRKIGYTSVMDRGIENTRKRAAAFRPGRFHHGDIGKLAWYGSLFGQLTLNAMGILLAYQHKVEELLPTSFYSLIAPLIVWATGETWAKYVIRASIFSIWWNPRFRENVRGFTAQLSGFQNWYKLQGIMVVTRWLSYCIIGTGLLADSTSDITVVAHVFFLVANFMLYFASKRPIKEEMRKLFVDSPIQFKHIAPSSRSNSPSQPSNSITAILDEIAAKPTTRNPASPPTPLWDESPLVRDHNKTSALNSNKDRSIGKQSSNYIPSTSRGYDNLSSSFKNLGTGSFGAYSTSPREPTTGVYDNSSIKDNTRGYGTSHTSSYNDDTRGYRKPYTSMHNRKPQGYNNSHTSYGKLASRNQHDFQPRNDFYEKFTAERKTPALLSMEPKEINAYFANGTIPERMRGTLKDGNDMEWDPTPQPKYRAFAPRPKDSAGSALVGFPGSGKFGQTPVTDNPNPFWYKNLPPAPITPAHRLRNPPNQPRLNISPNEVKENLFNKATRGNSEPDNAISNANTNNNKYANFEFAQQRLFAGEQQRESPGHDDLADRMARGWSLNDAEETVQPTLQEQLDQQEQQVLQRGWGINMYHLVLAIVLTIGFYVWGNYYNGRVKFSSNGTLAILVGCVCIGFRTILENTMWSDSGRSSAINLALGAVVGFFELAGSMYTILEVVFGRGELALCATLGRLLIGGMLLQELWLAFRM